MKTIRQVPLDNFEIGRLKAACALLYLGTLRRLRAAQKRAQKGGKHKPGLISGLAMSATDDQALFTKFCQLVDEIEGKATEEGKLK